MTTETMSVHRALSELKMLEKRINSEIGSVNFVTYATAGALNINGVKRGVYMDQMSADYQRVTDLYRRFAAIKDTVGESNATTYVTIAGEKMTVARAIAKKNNDVEHLDYLLRTLTSQYNQAQARVNTLNASLEQRANERIKAVHGSVTENNAEQAEQTKKLFIENETAQLIDPIGVAKVIVELRNYIDQFTAEVDAVLSESNAVTMITINY